MLEFEVAQARCVEIRGSSGLCPLMVDSCRERTVGRAHKPVAEASGCVVEEVERRRAEWVIPVDVAGRTTVGG